MTCVFQSFTIVLVAAFLVAATCASQESTQHRVILGTLKDTDVPPIAPNGGTTSSDLDPVLVSLETTRTLTLERGESFHLYDEFDPLWAELLLHTQQPIREISFSACGGRFAREWKPTNGSTIPFVRVVRALQSHTSCEFLATSICGTTGMQQQGNESSSSSRSVKKKNQMDESAIKTFFRTAAKVSSVTSTPLQFNERTPVLRRPVTHMQQQSSNGNWCGLALSQGGALCTQHIAPLLADHEHSTNSAFRAFFPSYTLVLGTRFHHLSVKGTRTVSGTGAIVLRVVQRFSFVLTQPSEFAQWNEHAVSANLSMTKTFRSSASLFQSYVKSASEVPVASSRVQFQWHYAQTNDADGTLTVELRVAKPQSSGSRYDIALCFPLALTRVLLHSVVGGTVLSVKDDDVSVSRVVVVQLDPLAADGSAKLEMHVDHSFVSIEELPSDPHKKYALPSPVLRTWVPCRRVTEHDVELDHSETIRMWFPPPTEQDITGMCAVFYRGQADGAGGLSTAVPDSAMLFNALTLGLLPGALLIGAVLRLTRSPSAE